MFSEGHRGLAKGTPSGGSETSPLWGSRGAGRVVVDEPHPAIGSMLEYLLSRHGYAVEVAGAVTVAPGPALVLFSVGEGGLYVFASGDAAEALRRLSADGPEETFSGTTGVCAYLPKPFGSDDVLRVVRAVDGFDGRRRKRSRSV